MNKTSYFCFSSRLSAQADPRLKNDTVLDLWKGFCGQAGEIALEEGEALSIKAGPVPAPAVPDGKEYAIVVTSDGFAVSGRDYACLVRGLMVLMMRIEYVDLKPGREAFRIAECRLESKYTIQNRMIHFCIFPETTPLYLKKCIRLAGVMQYTHVVLEFWGMLEYDCLKELAWSNAFSKDRAKAFIREIRDMGMEVIPMFNHLGHASACRVSGGKHVVLDQNPRLADLMVLNLLFLICCVPVVTIGPALSALYAVTLKMAKDEHSAILAGFLEAFRRNFKQAVLCWLGVLAVLAVIAWDLRLLLLSQPSALTSMLTTALLVVCGVILVWSQYLFPFLARFETTIPGALKSTLVLAIGYLPKSLLMGAMWVSAVAATFSGDIVFGIGLAFWPMMGFSLLALASAYLLRGIFDTVICEGNPPLDNKNE